MRFTRRAWFVNASAILLLAVSTQAFAQFRPKLWVQVSTDNLAGPASVMINDRTAVQILTPNGPMDPAQRAQIIAGRIQALIDYGAERSKLTSKVIGPGRADVMWGQQLIAIVNKKEAAAHGQTPAKVAAQWAANIRWLLASPPLTASPLSLTVPFGETRKVVVGGVGQAPVTAVDERPEVTKSTVSADSKTLTIRGLAPGSGSVILTRGEVSVAVNVVVRKFAGVLKTPKPVMVTGAPSPADMCLRLAKSAAVRSAVVEPGAYVLVMPPTTKLADLPQGYQADLTFPIRIEGDGYLPVAGSATVRIMNLALPKAEAAKLFYSNSPEQVKKYETLFNGRMEAGESARLLYHHQNMIGKPFAFNITLINPSAASARVQIVKAAPDPLVDTVAVGYRAGVQFLPLYLKDVGEIIDIPPMSKVAVYSRVVDKLYTASGIMQFRQLEGPAVGLRVSADLPEGGLLDEGSPIAATQGDTMTALSPWVYPSPTKLVEAEYTVGKPWAFIRVGKHGIPDNQGQQLYGNYGVLYDIKVQMANPGPDRKNIDVLFESTAGLVSGIFLIDGRYVKVTHIAPPREVPLARYTLAPNETKTVSIKTVPLAGSAYPATILVKS